jgi:hypothetical protein
MLLMRKIFKITWITIFLIINENLKAQQHIENQIISSVIINECKSRDPDTIFTRKGKIKKIRCFQISDIVLVNETQTSRESHFNDSIVINYLKQDLPDFDTEIYYDFKERNLHPFIIDSIKGFRAKVYYASKAEINTLLDGGNGWMSFYRKYHNSTLIEVSRPGINKMGNKALIYFSRGRGPLSGIGVYLFLELENNIWTVKGWSLSWIS